MKMFPILYGYRLKEEIEGLCAIGCTSIVICLPWPMLEKHEAQAQRNHGQTLARLAERGGLGPCEAVAILEDREHKRMNAGAAQRRLKELFATWVQAQPRNAGERARD